ncbi:MAG: hypothetical protein K1X89_18250 [Myxococcaceae bacterium]|nr:hypothetical protein [Myxococcaceae bacterium]
MRSTLGILSLIALAGCGAQPPCTDGRCLGDAGSDAGVDAGHLDGGLAYDVNDVSFLFPLPAFTLHGELLPLGASGPKGALMPKALYDQLPLKVGEYGEIRVVGVRVDPCFPGSTPPAAPSCVKQVRLVLQPIVSSETIDGGAGLPGLSVTQDHALHLFYVLDDVQFAAVTQGLRELKAIAGSTTNGKPLDVHPVLQAQGPGGAYWQRLNALVTQVCGEQTLVRAAITALTPPDRWVFQAFNLQGSTLVADEIPRAFGHTSQAFNEQGSTEHRAGVLTPSPAGDDLDTLLSWREVAQTDDFTLNSAIDSALFIEHPAKSSPKTIDCASCHVASRARAAAEVQRQKPSAGNPNRYTAPGFTLDRVDAAGNDPRAMRAFGYFGRLSALSQRTINESAEIAKALGPH